MQGRLFQDQSLLAIDDLINFAISVRRAIDVLGLKKTFVGLYLTPGTGPVATYYFENPATRTDITFLELLSRIVHSNLLTIIATSIPVGAELPQPTTYPHHFAVRSDRPGDFTISIESFILTYLTEVEHKLDTACWEAGVLSPNEDEFYTTKRPHGKAPEK